MISNFYSHGKLLITGEYFVLEGSAAFAVPLKLGQRMLVTSIDDGKNEINWKTLVKGNLDFQAIFDKDSLVLKSSFDLIRAKFVHNLLVYVKKFGRVLSIDSNSIEIVNHLEFPFEWGFGSSSSLISNVAYFANLNPFDLLFSTSKGSGYDIACARADSPIVYQLLDKPIVKEVSFSPNFLDKIFFVYLGRKQDSLISVERYWNKIKGKHEFAEKISSISNKILKSSTIEEFEGFVIEHESIISEVLELPTVKSKLFPDFDGTVKSLGAWGGDYVMATYNGNSLDVIDYFTNKGLNVVFPYKELVL